MQIIAVQNRDTCANTAALIADMHRLRCKIFRGRLGWDVSVRDGQEADQYDKLGPTYILAVLNERQVVGCARLLPADGPTMLRDTFPQLLGEGGLRSHAAMVESSRFCVDTLELGGGRSQVHQATLAMFAGIIEWSCLKGYTEIATVTDVRFERILRRAGWPMRRLGPPRQIDETLSVAGILAADRESFDRLRPTIYSSHFDRCAHLAA